ncbi:MAG TPA: response regulator transcription factor [Opitutaceae bacterium]|nr:response regulator transcription factor [Opitutaceae bacterium]
MTTALTTITVGIVEDSAPFRSRLRDFINASDDLHCTCTFANGASALAGLPAKSPDVVLMDLQLPDTSGVDCTFKLKSQLPGTQFMIFTVHEDSEQIFNALKAGASGYLLKRTPPDEILAAIRELHRGGAPMSSEIARKVVLSFRPEPRARTARPGLESLSPRQEEILRLLSQGHTVKEIADHTGLTVETVRSYLKLVYQKLHVRSRTEALLKYLG